MSSIPKTIIQTGKQKSDINQYSTEWIQKNPDYNYIFFDDDDCRKFLQDNFDPEVALSFDCLKPGAFKADLFRYAYLYIKGGVYIDLDCAPVVTLSEIVPCDFDFISVSERRNIRGIYQAFIACTPRCEFLLKAVKMIVNNCKTAYYPNVESEDIWVDILSITGPVLLCTAVNGIHRPGIHLYDGKRILFYILNDSNYIEDLNGKKIIVSKTEDAPEGNYADFFKKKQVYNSGIFTQQWRAEHSLTKLNIVCNRPETER